MNAAYEMGHARMRAAMLEQRPSGDEAFQMLTDLRSLRADHQPNSPEWNRLIGGTVALLQAFPHLSAHHRDVALSRLRDKFSRTEAGVT